VNAVVDETASITPQRFFTIPGRDPFDEIEWELRHALIPGKDGPAFDQKDVEFPRFWSQTATNIVAQKYFRGRMSSPERERSVKQMIGRIVDYRRRLGSPRRLLRNRRGGRRRSRPS
jgi:ribonucleoside-diphosphate reductase alpha chain